MDGTTLPGRFLSRIDKRPDGCWVWVGRVGANGYGRFDVKRSTFGWSARVAHRVAYESLVGEVPEGMELDHQCKNRRCCNPEHLKPMSHAENLRKDKVWETSARRRRERAHCVHGHPFTPENTYARKDGQGRVCRKCVAERMRALRAKP